MVKAKTYKATQTKLSPLTISLLIVLTVYVLFMLALFAWAILTASKAYMDDYSAFTIEGPDNILGLPKKFMLFEGESPVFPAIINNLKHY